MSLDVRTGFTGRTIFMTGGTGFVGKVLLYKILKEFPDVTRVYLLMRGKESRRFKRFLNPQERLDMEVLDSPCFEPLRNSIGDARWKMLCGKVKAVNGDITEDHIGLSEEDRAVLFNEVQMIVHLAATVDFNHRLDEALQMNTLGGLRVLAIAKSCRKLEAMTHISTCYVNYAREGRNIVNEERMYPISFDPEAMCKRILGMHPSEIPSETARLLCEYNFPNTYTLTKNIGERLIFRYKENVPVVVVRPSIIGCSLNEPFPGWVDALTAAGGLLLTTTLGVVRELVCKADMIADIVPVDFVVNVILKALFQVQQHHQRAQQASHHDAGAVHATAVASAERVQASAQSIPKWVLASVSQEAKSGLTNVVAVPQQQSTATVSELNGAELCRLHNTAGEEKMLTPNSGTTCPAGYECTDGLPFIFQAATSGTLNRASWGRLADSLQNYLRNTKLHPKALGPCAITLTKSNVYYLLRFHLLRNLPYLLLRAFTRLPQPIGTPDRRVMVDKLGRALHRANLLNNEFHDFVVHEWIHDSTNAIGLDVGLTEESKRALLFDPYTINWFSYTQHYTYGILKHIVRDVGSLAEPTTPPSATELFQRASSL